MSVTSFFLVGFIANMLDINSSTINLLFRISIVFLSSYILVITIFTGSISKLDRLQVVVLIFLILYSIRLVYDYYYGGKMIRNEPSVYMIYFFAGTFLPFIALTSVKSRQYHFSESVMTIIYYILSIIAIYFVFEFRFLIGTDFGRLQRAEFGINPLLVGYLGSMVLVFSIVRFRNYGRLYKVVIIFIIILSVILLSISGSRGPIIAVGVPVIIYVLFSNINLQSKILFIFIIILSIIILPIVFEMIGSSAIRRLSRTDLSDSEERFITLSQTLHLFYAYPLTGYGIELPQGRHPHNFILESFLTMGLVGGVLFIYMYIASLNKAIFNIRHNKLVQLSMLYIAVSVWVMFSSTIYFMNIYWILLALILKER